MIGKDVIEALDVALPALLLQQRRYEHCLNVVEDLVVDQEEKNRYVERWKSAIENAEKAYCCLMDFSIELNKLEGKKEKI